MTLQNLLKIGQLDEHQTDSTQVGRMLESAQRSLIDARQDLISPETRLDAAYRAIMQLCMVALWAKGFRPTKSKPGHHRTMIQALVHTVGLDNETVYLLDTFRVKRNASDYTGHAVDDSSLDACTQSAQELYEHVVHWIERNRPDLLN